MCSRSPQILEFGHFTLLKGPLSGDDDDVNENVRNNGFNKENTGMAIMGYKSDRPARLPSVFFSLFIIGKMVKTTVLEQDPPNPKTLLHSQPNLVSTQISHGQAEGRDLTFRHSRTD